MKFAFFPGCKIPYHMPQYGDGVKTILDRLDVGTIDIEFSCCGYSARSINFTAYMFSAAKNLALAEEQGLDILTPCKCCFGSLKHAIAMLEEKPELKDEINEMLSEDDLEYKGTTQVTHVLKVLHDVVGVDAIREKVTRQFDGVKIAAHYGCHALRPSNVTQFDDPVDPVIFEKLIEVTGASAVAWDKRLECCGSPMKDHNADVSDMIMDKKLKSAGAAGADYICTACTYCQMQFESTELGDNPAPILFSQVLGLSMGLEEKDLGLTLNRNDASSLMDCLQK